MQKTYKLAHTIDTRSILGENALWDHRESCFWWTDILGLKLFRWWFQQDKLDTFNVDEPLCSFGLTNDPNKLICAFSGGFSLFSPTDDKKIWYLSVADCGGSIRMNDGRVDPAGRFWAGSMVQDNATTKKRGKLYRLDSATEYSDVLDGIQISNGLCWSPDGDSMYFADSPTGQIERYHFDRNKGIPSNPVEFAKTANGVDPDGACVDSDNGMWSAHWNGSQVVRYKPNGDVDLTLLVPAKQPTSVCFGGHDMAHLFVTSAQVGLSKETAESEHNGKVLVYKTPNTGHKQTICALGT